MLSKMEIFFSLTIFHPIYSASNQFSVNIQAKDTTAQES